MPMWRFSLVCPLLNPRPHGPLPSNFKALCGRGWMCRACALARMSAPTGFDSDFRSQRLVGSDSGSRDTARLDRKPSQMQHDNDIRRPTSLSISAAAHDVHAWCCRWQRWL